MTIIRMGISSAWNYKRGSDTSQIIIEYLRGLRGDPV